MPSLEALQYPIGRFTPAPDPLDPAARTALIDSISALPGQLREAVRGLDEEQLDTPYRDGGWTVRQVVHHVVDSHVNSYVRFKLAATEEVPTICTYDQEAWAEEPEARGAPVGLSLDLLEALHRRWVVWLRVVDEEVWARRFRHPELGMVTLDRNLQLYAWHGRHHTAHITGLREREGW